MPREAGLSNAAGSPTPVHSRLALRDVLLVWLGGTVGCGLRAALSLAIPSGDGVPMATLTVNILGAFVLGYLLQRLSRSRGSLGVRQDVRLVAGTGLLGGFTTYSSFAVETTELIADQPAMALGYVAATLTFGLLAARLGQLIATRTATQ